jgi:hypothetical protein
VEGTRLGLGQGKQDLGSMTAETVQGRISNTEAATGQRQNTNRT